MIGDEVRQAREQAGLSVQEFAALVGVNPRTIDRIEKDETNPSPGVALKVQRALKILEQPEGSSADDVAAVAKARQSISLSPHLGMTLRDLAIFNPMAQLNPVAQLQQQMQQQMADTIQSMTAQLNPVAQLQQQMQQQMADTMQSMTASMATSLHSVFDVQNAVSQQLAHITTATTAMMANLTRLPSISDLGLRLGDYTPLTASLTNLNFPDISEQIANAQSMEDSLQSTLASALAAIKEVADTKPNVNSLGQNVRDAIASMGFDSASAAVAAMGVNGVQEAVIAMLVDKVAAFANTGIDSVQQAAAAIGPTKASEAVTNALGGDAPAIYSLPPAVRLMQLQAEIEQRHEENIARRVVAGIGGQLGSAIKSKSANSEGRIAILEARLQAYDELPSPSQEGQADVDPTRALLLWVAQSIREDTEGELEQLRQRRAAANPG